MGFAVMRTVCPSCTTVPATRCVTPSCRAISEIEVGLFLKETPRRGRPPSALARGRAHPSPPRSAHPRKTRAPDRRRDAPAHLRRGTGLPTRDFRSHGSGDPCHMLRATTEQRPPPHPQRLRLFPAGHAGPRHTQKRFRPECLAILRLKRRSFEGSAAGRLGVLCRAHFAGGTGQLARLPEPSFAPLPGAVALPEPSRSGVP